MATWAPPRHRGVGAYLLLSGAIAAAVGSGITGAVAFSDWGTVSTDSQNKIYGRTLDPSQLNGSYTANKTLVEPLGVVSEVALAIAVGLGVATWVVW